MLSNTTRILLGIGSLLLIITYFVPLWQILLWAPQYPEGLTMKIWMRKLSGEVDIINGLNHYIGMKHISVEMFSEFKYMGLLVGFLILVGLLAAITGRSRVLFFFTMLSYIYGVAAMWDFWLWGYDYGHNLDPNAAIKVPDMSYQPPLIGYKNLLNFTSFSGPDTGAWIMIVVCLTATVLWWWEFFKRKKNAETGRVLSTKMTMTLIGFGMIQLTACSSGPEPIRYGKDNCEHCKMTLSDKRFGAEIITSKGKVYKFDDLNCVVDYMHEKNISEKDIAQIVSTDFKKTGSFIDINQAFLIQHDAIKSPMRSDIACFSDKKDLEAIKAELNGGKEMTWGEVMATF